MKLLTLLLAALLPIIPYPHDVVLEKGNFNAKGAMFNCDESVSDAGFEQIALLAEDLSTCCGRRSSVARTIRLRESAESGKVSGFVFYKDPDVPAEGYGLAVRKNYVLVKFSNYKGLLNAIQSIRQLLPEGIFARTLDEKERWSIPCCTVNDAPRFAWRGMHLDSARHFWNVDEVKKYLDVMAMYKMNRFHWHLTDDQGWRIEIRRYPLLTEVGGFRDGTCIGHNLNSNDGVRYGGYYTQDQVREVVAYAAKLGIDVVPEIDLPGHMRAALASYPEFGCAGGPYTVWTRWGVANEVLCAGKEETLIFLENILSEIAEIFPYGYIHIGGDECPKTEWEKCPDCQARIRELGLKDTNNGTKEQYLQNYVTARIQKFLVGKGKRIIGWEEIMEGELESGATVMAWKSAKAGADAVKKGFDVIMSPLEHCYFDFPQSGNSNEPLGGWKILSLGKVYEFNPTKGISPEDAHHILGAQANLWTEYVATPEHLEYMLLPRMQALSEVQWCSPDNKDYDRFVSALSGKHLKILEILGYNYRKID